MDLLKNEIKNNPNNSLLWQDLGDLLCDDNRLIKALKCYKRANELTPCDSLQKKILRLEEELDIDTEDEDEEEMINTEEILGIHSESFFNLVLENSVIKEKLNNPEFQQKILNNESNPNIMFEDNEIMTVMKEMMNVYKKDS